MAQNHDIGIDLGTSQVLISARGRGIVLREPAVVAVDRNTGKVSIQRLISGSMVDHDHDHITA